jgi:ferredoxin--NADP+ reductase
MELEARYNVAVIGAGPAGLYAARQLADRNIHTILFNRDVKPGGLAEYGIYLNKIRMKEGLRSQFRQIIALDDVEYYGNVLVGEHSADLTLDSIRELGFQALLVTVGAQSTKRLGIPGEDLSNVFHAKDIVYHYNLLPPYSERAYPIGKRVAVIGAGNVMMDITRWLVEERKVDAVIAVARRGPAEVKFDRKELESVIGYLDMPALQDELRRVEPVMNEVGQGPDEFLSMIRKTAEKTGEEGQNCAETNRTCFSMQFLSSPNRIIGDDHGQVTGLEVEENRLLLNNDGEVRPKGTGRTRVIDVDTVIFAIGDVVDSTLGIPIQNGEYVKNPQPRFPVDGLSYEVFDPLEGQVVPDVFLAGWARRASTGLVGVARKDATNAAQAIIQYLQTMPMTDAPVFERTRERMLMLSHPVIDKAGLQQLEMLEREQAQALKLETFKFSSNQQMFEALNLIPKIPRV